MPENQLLPPVRSKSLAKADSGSRAAGWVLRLRRNYTVRKWPSPASRAADRHHQQSHFFIVFVLILLVLIGSVLGFLINIFRID